MVNLLNNFESFDNSETSARKSALIQERVGLVSTHMYKQFLDYQHANVNTNEIFFRMIMIIYTSQISQGQKLLVKI